MMISCDQARAIAYHYQANAIYWRLQGDMALAGLWAGRAVQIENDFC
jgi:hypothetical protein